MSDYTTVFPIEWLPDDWDKRAEVAVKEYGKTVQVQGRGPGSLEPEETAGLDYRVLDGAGVKENFPDLWNWYRSDRMVDLVSVLVGYDVSPSDHLGSSININYLEGQAARYELHTDGQPYSAVLMGTPCDDTTGGRLILGAHGHRNTIYVDTKPGLLVVFDGSVIPHAVEPIHGVASRLSVPMIYSPIGGESRPAGLDDYLYGKS